MIAFGHTAVGASIGLATYQLIGGTDIALGLITAGALGIISHYITDFIPHGHFFNEKGYKSKVIYVIIFDLLLSILLFLGTAHLIGDSPKQLLYILFGIGGAQLPDVLDGLIYIDLLPVVGFFKLENRFHRYLHWHGVGEKTLLLGKRDIWQLAIVILSLFYIIKS